MSLNTADAGRRRGCEKVLLCYEACVHIIYVCDGRNEMSYGKCSFDECLYRTEGTPEYAEKVKEYKELLASGLSDYEARDTVWPSSR